MTILNERENKIVYDYFCDQYNDVKASVDECEKLKFLITHDKKYQIVSFGNIVFLLKIENNEVEFHSMGKEKSAFAFIKNIYKLIDYVKELKVSAICTYGNDIVFEKLYERVLVNASKEIKVYHDGNAYNYYRLEF